MCPPFIEIHNVTLKYLFLYKSHQFVVKVQNKLLNLFLFIGILKHLTLCLNENLNTSFLKRSFS